MNIVDLIAAKRDGRELKAAEIAYVVRDYTEGIIPDYQMAALAMAIYLRGMTTAETAALTDQMLQSGERLRWSPGPPVVDKHSTGGVGDKVSLILAPALAVCGCRVPMISGRGLGPTGGTLDKLESIPGFRTDLSMEELQQITQRVGCVISGATGDIAPADRKLYGLRDVTATVASIPLITASIMSKKLAESPQALVFDVKFGSGAFMQSFEQARRLAQSLCSTGTRMGVATAALLTDMNQPLGAMVGNTLEVLEAIETLQGRGPFDVRELTIALGCAALMAAGVRQDRAAARQAIESSLDDGTAWERFERMVAAQGGRLPPCAASEFVTELTAPKSGILQAVATAQLGRAVIALGGGRRRLEDPIDHGSGLQMLVRIGDPLAAGQPWIRVYHRHRRPDAEVIELLQAALRIGEEPVMPPPLIRSVNGVPDGGG